MSRDTGFLIGKALKKIREFRNMSQHELAILWGVSDSFVSYLERGAKNASVKNIRNLARVLEIPPSFIFILADNSSTKLVGDLQRLVAKFVERAG